MKKVYRIINAFDDVAPELFHYYIDELELTSTTVKDAVKEAEQLQEKHDATAYKYCPEKLVVERAPCYVNRLYEVTLIPCYMLNDDGFELLSDFIRNTMRNGEELSQTSSVLDAWALQAENSASSGHPQIEIRSSDSVTGRPEILRFNLEKHFDKYHSEEFERLITSGKL